MFSPPVHRVASAVLDRSLFTKTLRLAAASVVDKRQIVKCRTLLEKSKDLLRVERVQSVQDVHGPGNTLLKGLLLRPDIKAEGNLLVFRSRHVLIELFRPHNMEFCSTRCCGQKGAWPNPFRLEAQLQPLDISYVRRQRNIAQYIC
jgi:hypothetical protein